MPFGSCMTTLKENKWDIAKNKTAVYKVYLILSYLNTPQQLILAISWASVCCLLYPRLTTTTFTFTFTVLFYHKNKTAVLFFLHFWGVSVTCWSNLRVLSVIFNLLTSETENMLQQKTKVKWMSLCRAHDATDRVVWQIGYRVSIF